MSESRLKKWRAWAAVVGVVLALACQFLPQEYRAMCQAVSAACNGGL